MGMSAFILKGMQTALVIFVCITLIRLMLGPTSSDRLVALNVLSAVSLALLILWGIQTGRTLYLDVALVYDIFGFLGFLAITRFLKNRKEGR
jgi:multicomponent Na+:H+ antiporter subunit F